MALYKADGTKITRAQLLALTTADADPEVTINETIYEDTQYVGGSSEGGREIKWQAGEKVRMSEINAEYPLPTVTSVTPNTGPAAGGTTVTIHGTGFVRGHDVIPGGQEAEEPGGVATVALGGAACTAVTVVDDTTITCHTGAHATGAVNAVVTTDAGPSSALAGAFTYT